MIDKSLKHNIWKISGYMATNSRIFISIISMYYLTIPDVQIQNVGLIFLISSIASFIFEVPSGYLSDKIGHKKMLVISKSLLVLATLILIIADSFTWLVTAGVIASIANACSSGTVNAFMMNTLEELKLGKKYSKIMGKANGYALMFSLTFSAFVPFLTGISFTAPFILALIIDIIGLIITISLKDIKLEDKMVKKNEKVKFSEVIKQAQSLNYLPIAIATGFIFGSINGLQIFRGPYQGFSGVDVTLFGVCFATGRLMASIMMLYSGKIKKLFKDIYSFEKFQVIFFTIALLFLALSNDKNIIIVTFIVINAMMWGVSQVRNHFYLELLESSNFKATLLSLRDQYTQLATAVISISLGYLINLYSYKYALIVLTLYFSIIASMLLLRAYNKRRKNKLVQLIENI